MPRTRNEEEEEDTRTGDDDSNEDELDPKELTPVRPKVGEDTGNLKQREEWFQKRSGRK